MESLCQWKAAHHEAWCQEDLFLSVQGPTEPKDRILLEHRPDFSLDPVVNGGIENDRAAQEICAASGEIRPNCALNVP
jgi:hypothetical protein